MSATTAHHIPGWRTIRPKCDRCPGTPRTALAKVVGFSSIALVALSERCGPMTPRPWGSSQNQEPPCRCWSTPYDRRTRRAPQLPGCSMTTPPGRRRTTGLGPCKRATSPPWGQDAALPRCRPKHSKTRARPAARTPDPDCGHQDLVVARTNAAVSSAQFRLLKGSWGSPNFATAVLENRCASGREPGCKKTGVHRDSQMPSAKGIWLSGGQIGTQQASSADDAGGSSQKRPLCRRAGKHRRRSVHVGGEGDGQVARSIPCIPTRAAPLDADHQIG